MREGERLFKLVYIVHKYNKITEKVALLFVHDSSIEPRLELGIEAKRKSAIL